MQKRSCLIHALDVPPTRNDSLCQPSEMTNHYHRDEHVYFPNSSRSFFSIWLRCHFVAPASNSKWGRRVMHSHSGIDEFTVIVKSWTALRSTRRITVLFDNMCFLFSWRLTNSFLLFSYISAAKTMCSWFLSLLAMLMTLKLYACSNYFTLCFAMCVRNGEC